MEAIVNKTEWPKFLKVSVGVERLKYNAHLLCPWRPGEVVKVLPFEDQRGNVLGETNEKFRKRYVSVLRRTAEGAWTLKYTWDWGIFEKITK